VTLWFGYVSSTWNFKCDKLENIYANWSNSRSIFEGIFEGLGEIWFKLHRSCQSVSLLIGIIGFDTGLYFGNHYEIHDTPHKCIGITLTCLACAQVFVAVFLRPKKDHKFKIYWNIIHYIIGYGTIALAILNVLKGFDILGADKIWKKAYVGIIICFAAFALVLEVITWILVCHKEKARKSQQQMDRSLPQP
jgi:uncharacterized membrane protein HdeD (DUF308 family)